MAWRKPCHKLPNWRLELVGKREGGFDPRVSGGRKGVECGGVGERDSCGANEMGRSNGLYNSKGLRPMQVSLEIHNPNQH